MLVAMADLGYGGPWLWRTVTFYWRVLYSRPNYDYLVSFLRYLMSRIVVTLKSGSKVTQGQRNRHGSIRHLWLPINVTLQPWAYLVPFPRETAISVENRQISQPRGGVPFEL